MIGDTLDRDALRGYALEVRHSADRDPFVLQDRPLLDMQLDIGPRPEEARLLPDVETGRGHPARNRIAARLAGVGGGQAGQAAVLRAPDLAEAPDALQQTVGIDRQRQTVHAGSPGRSASVTTIETRLAGWPPRPPAGATSLHRRSAAAKPRAARPPADQCGETSLRPTMPATIRPTQARRGMLSASPNRVMPRAAVPSVPMPVQIA